MAKREVFGALEVSRIIGVDYARIDFWARQGFATPSFAEAEGRGSRRLYTFFDVFALSVAKILRDQGFPWERVKKVTDLLRLYEYDERWLSMQYLIIAPEKVLVGKPKNAIDLVRSGQPVWGLALGKVMEELRSKVAEVAATKKKGRDSPPKELVLV